MFELVRRRLGRTSQDHAVMPPPQTNASGVIEHDPNGSIDDKLQAIVSRREHKPHLHDYESCWRCLDAVDSYDEYEHVVHVTGEIGNFWCWDDFWWTICGLCSKAVYQFSGSYDRNHPECALKRFEQVYGPCQDWRKCKCGKYCNKDGIEIRDVDSDAPDDQDSEKVIDYLQAELANNSNCCDRHN